MPPPLTPRNTMNLRMSAQALIVSMIGVPLLKYATTASAQISMFGPLPCGPLNTPPWLKTPLRFTLPSVVIAM